ncbi:hypothetical protein K501DRAFT_289048 [Backusella circina FSU 941]|nr:hypothetical protein K501DRAFT_289048 [Backusella circina FSU 941]
MHSEIIFDIEQEIRRNDIVPKQTLEIEFNVDTKKGVDIPSFCRREGVDGGKIDYMVVAILETAGFIGRTEKAKAIIDVPLIAKVNVAEANLRKIKETSITWPRNEEEINQCRLHALIPGSGWMRGKSIPVHISWKQPERYLSAKKIELVLVKQETIASSKDKPPNMSLQLPDKPIVTVKRDLQLVRDQRNEAMVMSNNFEIDIPSNITPTIHGNGMTVQIDYKLSITVFLPEMGPYNQDREVSVNLDVVIGTVYENGAFDISNQVERLSISSRHGSMSSMGHRVYIPPPQPPVKERDHTFPVGNNNAIKLPLDDSDYVQRSTTHHSPTTYHTTNQIPGHPQSTPPPLQTNIGYPPQPPVNNTGYPPVPHINTVHPPPTPTHTGYPPNTHHGFSPSTNKSFQEFSGNRLEHTDSINYQTTPSNTSPSQKLQQLNIYPPDNSEPTLPMEYSSQDEEVMKTNRKIEQSVYPPLEDNPDVFEMASPVCYMDQFQNDFFSSESGIQESNSDENTTLSSKNSYRNNDKTQQKQYPY